MTAYITVPTYNEIENVDPLIDAVLAQAPDIHLVIVDDNSPDGTGQRVRERMAAEPRLHLIARPGKLGLASAEIAGLRYGLEQGAELLVHMDADFSHDPDYLPPLLAMAARGEADVVVGSRYVAGGGTKNWGLSRILLSKTANLVARRLLRLTVDDCTSGFRCYRREVLEGFDFAQVTVDGYSYLIEMTYLCQQAGWRFGQVPIVFEDRRRGKSKISKRIIFEAAALVLRRFAQRLARGPSQPSGSGLEIM